MTQYTLHVKIKNLDPDSVFHPQSGSSGVSTRHMSTPDDPDCG